MKIPLCHNHGNKHCINVAKGEHLAMFNMVILADKKFQAQFKVIGHLYNNLIIALQKNTDLGYNIRIHIK